MEKILLPTKEEGEEEVFPRRGFSFVQGLLREGFGGQGSETGDMEDYTRKYSLKVLANWTFEHESREVQ